YDGSGSRTGAAQAIALDGAGNVFVTGESAPSTGGFQHFTTVAYDATTGMQLWVATDDNGGVVHAIAFDSAGGTVYVTGEGVGLGSDYVTVAYDPPTGVQLWEARYHGPNSSRSETARAIAVDGQGGVYVTGSSANAAFGSSDYATVAYDA